MADFLCLFFSASFPLVAGILGTGLDVLAGILRSREDRPVSLSLWLKKARVRRWKRTRLAVRSFFLFLSIFLLSALFLPGLPGREAEKGYILGHPTSGFYESDEAYIAPYGDSFYVHDKRLQRDMLFDTVDVPYAGIGIRYVGQAEPLYEEVLETRKREARQRFADSTKSFLLDVVKSRDFSERTEEDDVAVHKVFYASLPFSMKVPVIRSVSKENNAWFYRVEFHGWMPVEPFHGDVPQGEAGLALNDALAAAMVLASVLVPEQASVQASDTELQSLLVSSCSGPPMD